MVWRAGSVQWYYNSTYWTMRCEATLQLNSSSLLSSVKYQHAVTWLVVFSVLTCILILQSLAFDATNSIKHRHSLFVCLSVCLSVTRTDNKHYLTRLRYFDEQFNMLTLIAMTSYMRSTSQHYKGWQLTRFRMASLSDRWPLTTDQHYYLHSLSCL